MTGADEPGIGLYVHLPVCRMRCDYCDFFTRVGVSPRRQEALLLRTCDLLEAKVSRYGRSAVKTIYLGGGTPSAVDDRALDQLLTWIAGVTSGLPHTPIEVTMEVNPEDVTVDALTAWQQAGVNRLSVGIQSLRERSLSVIGRHVSREATHRGLECLAGNWAGRWSADVITAIPGIAPADAVADLGEIARFDPPHLSVYELGIEAGTPLARRWQRDRHVRPDAVSDEAAAVVFAVHAELRRFGYDRYEISSWARGGDRSLHNRRYWRMEPVAGVGPGSVGFERAADGRWERLHSARDFDRFLDPTRDPYDHEILDRRTLAQELLMTGLRTADGLDVDRGRRIFGVDVMPVIRAVAERHPTAFAMCEPNGVVLTEHGLTFLDTILRDAFRFLDDLFPPEARVERLGKS